MANYLTRRNRTIKKWLKYNKPLFDFLKSDCQGKKPTRGFAFLPDLDTHAEARQISTEELFAELAEQVGDLGWAKLYLVHSDVDNAWHVGITLK